MWVHRTCGELDETRLTHMGVELNGRRRVLVVAACARCVEQLLVPSATFAPAVAKAA